MRNVIFFLYALFLILFSCFTYFFIDPGFFYLKTIFTGIAFSNRLLTTCLYIFFVFGSFGFYGYFLFLIRRRRLTPKSLSGIIVISFVCLVFSYPTMISYDLFNYMATAKVAFYYFENPYMVMPIEFINEPFLDYTRAANKYALYGPSWILLSSVPFYLSLQNVVLQLFLFKIFVGVFYVLTVYFLYKLSKSIFLTSLFALNPFVLFEIFVSGHNDIVMIFFILASFYYIRNKKIFYALALLILSIFIKYATFLLVPVFFYLVWKIKTGRHINWNLIWKYSSIFMLIAFALSPLREELYPWYFLWVFPFILLWENKYAIMLSISISFGFLFYYAPYMYTGHYLILQKYILVLMLSVCMFALLYLINKVKVMKKL